MKIAGTDLSDVTRAMTAQNRAVWQCVKASLGRGEHVAWTETPDVDPDQAEPVSGAESDESAGHHYPEEWDR